MTTVDVEEIHTTTNEEESEKSQEEVTMDSDKLEERLGLLEGQPQVTVKSTKRSSKLCYLAIIVLLLVVLAAIVAIVVSLTVSFVPDESNSGTKEKLTLEDVFDPSFQTKVFTGTWTNNGQLLHYSQDGVMLYDPVSNTSETLIDSSLLDDLKISSVKLSPTGEYVLLIGNITKIYRHSFFGTYYIHKLDQSTTWLLATDVLYGEWNPVNDLLVYIKEYDVYTYSIASNTSQRYTSNGMKNNIYNGVPDWVYEEEVLSSNYALWWSTGGQYILYFTFNDSQVEQFKFPIYGPFYDQYTDIDSISYPKAGHYNPTVKVYVLSIDDEDTIELIVPESFANEDHYVLSGGWINDSTPVVSWMNREQNRVIHCSYTISSSSQCNELYSQSSKAWVEVVKPPLFYDGFMALIDSVDTIEGADSFLNLILIDLNTSEVIYQAAGPWEVTDIISFTENTILYITTSTNPWQRHIYSSSDGKCLTCDWWSSSHNCSYWSGSCSTGSDKLIYCLLQCSGPVIPFTLLVDFNNYQFNTIAYFERNEALYNVTKNKALPTVEQIEIPSTSTDEPILFGRVLNPPNFVKDCTKTYPVLFYVYGGPYSQMIGEIAVTSRLFIAYLSSQLDMIIVSVDGRGTGFRGNNFKYSVYHRLGILETEDQLRAAKYFQQKCYCDSEQFTIYGSSYGGYMAGMVGASGSSLFKSAISQSPVTDWIYYDSIYTERYMGVPDTNVNGYKESSLLTRVGNISLLSHYLLIHGTGDDNVHFQNTAQLVNVLTESDIQYQLMIYTDQDHSLSGGNTRNHLYQLITDFLIVH